MANGAQGRNRTTDTAIFSRMLYQLSYLGALSKGLSPIERAGYSGPKQRCPPWRAMRRDGIVARNNLSICLSLIFLARTPSTFVAVQNLSPILRILRQHAAIRRPRHPDRG